MRVKKWNVVRNKETQQKQVVHKDQELPDELFEFICDAPHEDGDFSYLCGSDYCRCCQ